MKRVPNGSGCQPDCMYAACLSVLLVGVCEQEDKPLQKFMENVFSLFVFLVFLDVGFEIPNRFVVGYALDYNEYFRDLNVSFYSCINDSPFIFI